ncbi:AraC family transcriptional regulator [Colwelliaceae bacterium 6471]
MNNNPQHKNTLGIASIPAVNQYLQLANEYELDVNSVIEKSAIDQAILTDNSAHIEGEKFQHLIAELLALSNDELFGLHTAKYVQPGSYSVLGYISMNCETLGEAITKIQPFEKLVGDMGTTDLSQIDNNLRISWHCIYPNKQVRRHMIDNVLASWLTFARYLVGEKHAPLFVQLTRAKPDLQQQKEYQMLFNCPIQYQQSIDAITFKASLLEMPLNKGDKQLLSTLESHAQTIISSLSVTDDITAKVEALIKSNLKTGRIRQQDIADLLGLGAKTLQRRLAEKSTTFQQVLDVSRLNQAKYLLNDTQLNLVQISIELGFVEPRSFYRWFNKLMQCTPGDYRINNN